MKRWVRGKMTDFPRFPHQAMATAFEIVIADESADYARQAAEAAFGEIDRLELLLSRYNDASDIARINRLRPGESLRVGLQTFECLRAATKACEETNGAFDITVGPLVDYWKGRKDNGSDEEINALRRRVGIRHLDLREETDEAGGKAFVVGVKQEGVEVDPGGIGKGFALDQAAGVLRDWSICCALLDSGGSTLLALGATPGEEGWPVSAGGVPDHPELARRVLLRDRALSSSGGEFQGRHVIDPRTGRPAEGKAAAWSLAPTAAEADALSTAFLVMSETEIERYRAHHSSAAALLAVRSAAGAIQTRSFGFAFAD
ncbi:MAG: FAD:protein FMN transferase [Candidatus Sumerlaeota bacterium]|nr:FAD:protein FMN transferase [Candidatus Sumerlaeota bacterium]